ncbi:Armadillo-like helical-containing protein [Dioscorea alata]|uniref:Armadillo-like helical-containing protein n=1 Tax=Dioscorea alata TaxID=55571 RepID=A0ACB7VI96_DIOAL|nr:Armadillo-like helical-containing protein [Dioscorea alata]
MPSERSTSRATAQEDEEEEEEEEEEKEEEAPSHLPLAPSSESLDLSTTIDPSYIISLIRQLLPCNVKGETNDAKECEEPKIDDANNRQHGTPEIVDPWEECGCILWDLAVNKSHAEFMVNNLLLDVLLGTLNISKSPRVTEICLGIMGNLACHDALIDAIVSTNGLVETVVNQLLLDDSLCLSETFRLLTVGLQGRRSASWSEALKDEQILLHILWIVGNTLNSTLLEKSIEFLLAIIDNQEVANILLQPLTKSGLPTSLVDLLSCEIGKLRSRNKLERSTALELILCAIEGLSAAHNSLESVSSNEQLFHLACDVVKLFDKFEFGSSCVSAAIIIANMLTDNENLASGISQDFTFLHGLLDILPFVTDDSQARNALWSILARLLVQVVENDLSPSTLCHFASVFSQKSSLIEEDLAGHSMQNFEEIDSTNMSKTSDATVDAVKKIVQILEKLMENSQVCDGVASRGDDGNSFRRLLEFCRKYTI